MCAAQNSTSNGDTAAIRTSSTPTYDATANSGDGNNAVNGNDVTSSSPASPTYRTTMEPSYGDTTTTTHQVDNTSKKPTNEYVLNVAFLSFLGFTTLQFFFALIAKSQSMMADCAAMYVDVVTYLFNYLAEHFKRGHSGMTSRDLRLRRLYLELVPPTISVGTLVAVTILALDQAFATILHPPPDGGKEPDLVIMLLFSAMNLLLDVFNVGCFARIDQAVGIPGQSHDATEWTTSQRNLINNSNSNNIHKESDRASSVATESTPLSLIRDDDDDDDDSENVSRTSTEENGTINLNMCSAWTHIFADTLRSVAVLVAAGFAYLFPSVLSPTAADSMGAIVVSVIILLSLIPLVQGLFQTAYKIRAMHSEHDPTMIVRSAAARTAVQLDV